MTAVAYCYGLKAQDANPTPHEAPNFDQFVAQILVLPRARSKGTRTYICGPMRVNGNGEAHRCKADLLPRVWLAKDLDGGSREEVAILLMRLSDYRAVAWTTLRHTPECPRLRIVLSLDRLVDGPEGERLGAGFTGVLGAGLPSLKWDRSTDHGEQACYLPTADAEVMHYNGDPVDVDAVLALAPEPPRARPATPDPYEALIIERGLFLREIDPGKAAITCPFEGAHSEQTSDTATVYFRPNYNGHKWGKIFCMHSHCADRQQEDYIRALGAEHRDVWRKQAGSAPYDDLPPLEAYDEAQEDAGAKEYGRGNGAAPGGAAEAKVDHGGTSEDARSAEEWPEPGHISPELLPVPAFDPDVLLPEPLRGWIVDQAEGMPCPIEFIAVPALVMAGSVIGARCGIRPKVHSHWVSIPNLWGGIVGAPGSMKSPAIYAASRPLALVIKAAKMAHAEAMRDYSARNKVHAAQEDGPEQEEEAQPIEKRYKTNDCTIEKLADLLIENPAGLLVQRDELVGLIASWDMKGHEQARTFYLESWTGYEDKEVDRIKRGSSYVPILCLSVFGGIQPAKLAWYLNQARDALANDGMLQRFQMLVYPDPVRWENVDRKPNTASLDRAYGIFKALAEMVPEHWGAASNRFIKFPYFVFEDAAQGAFNEWHTELHRTRILAEDDPLIAQCLSKLDNLFLGLALIFHLIDIADTQIPQPGETLAAKIPSWAAWVSLAAVQRAKAWCIHLEAHARRCYGMMVSDALRAAQALAAKVRGGKLEDGFTLRDVLRKRWHGLTEVADIEAALGWLEEEGWLRGSIGGTGQNGGRPTTRYRINPRIRAGAR